MPPWEATHADLLSHHDFSPKWLAHMRRLTQPIGLQLAEMPVEPLLGAALLAASRSGCAEEVATVVGMLSVRSVWISRGDQRGLDEAKARCPVHTCQEKQSKPLTVHCTFAGLTERCLAQVLREPSNAVAQGIQVLEIVCCMKILIHAGGQGR